jgi:hypothetical protein
MIARRVYQELLPTAHSTPPDQTHTSAADIAHEMGDDARFDCQPLPRALDARGEFGKMGAMRGYIT